MLHLYGINQSEGSIRNIASTVSFPALNWYTFVDFGVVILLEGRIGMLVSQRVVF